VHHRNNEDVIGFDRIKYGVGKDVNKTPPHILLELSPARRCLGNLPKCRLYAGNEPKFEAGLTAGVEARSVLEFV
jgi:hypothetical protein